MPVSVIINNYNYAGYCLQWVSQQVVSRFRRVDAKPGRRSLIGGRILKYCLHTPLRLTNPTLAVIYVAH